MRVSAVPVHVERQLLRALVAPHERAHRGLRQMADPWTFDEGLSELTTLLFRGYITHLLHIPSTALPLSAAAAAAEGETVERTREGGSYCVVLLCLPSFPDLFNKWIQMSRDLMYSYLQKW